jgi:hypothetical protein
MKWVARVSILGVILALAVCGIARADSIDGVIANYDSGNQGTDMTVRSSDGRNHALWFDNMKKPLFQGTALPWCPSFPCSGWPKALVLNKTRVRTYTVKETVGGHVVQTPTRIELLH